MNPLREAAQQALEALLNSRPLATEDDFAIKVRKHSEAITALKAALAQEQAEPAQDQRCRAEPLSGGNFVCDCKIGECPGRSTAPPQRKLMPLTEEEIYHATRHSGVSRYTAINIARAVELAHGIEE